MALELGALESSSTLKSTGMSLMLGICNAQGDVGVRIWGYKMHYCMTRSHVKTHLIGSWAAGEELPWPDPRVLPVTPLELLDAHPAHALYKATLNLTNVDGGVDGVANVHHDVGPAELWERGETEVKLI